jgi:rod shape-determining protein MreD
LKVTLWTGLAILFALLFQTILSRVLPAEARTFDPFLIVLVYCGLTGGETHGMLAGVAAGWVQDVHFGGPVVGLSGLTKVVVGFVVGLAGTRFLLGGTGSRLLVLFAATAADALLFEQLTALFEIKSYTLSPEALLARAAVNALLGTFVFGLLDRHVQREARG